MVMYYILGGIVVLSVIVVGYIFVILSKESAGPNEVKIEPIAAPSLFDLKDVEYKKKIEELEDELRQLAEKHLTRDSEFIGKLDGLTSENNLLKESLSKQSDAHAKQIDLAQEQMHQLNQENLLLKQQLQEATDKISALEHQADSAHGLMEGDLAMARSMIEQLKTERDAFVSNREAALQSAQLLTREFDDIKQRYESLTAKDEELRLDNIKLKELSDGLIEKNKLVQMELAKYRAQASGLEKICENYKLQLSEQANA